MAVGGLLDVPGPGTPLACVADALTGLLDATKAAGVVERAVTVADVAMLLAQVPDDPTGRVRARYLDPAGLIG